MIATDVIRELGDPDKVCGLENHIVLKFDEPWRPSQKSASAHLPEGLRLEAGGQLMTATAESFVASRDTLCQSRVVAALFAGCAAFQSCRRLATAARKVLAEAQTLVIVHNRDYVVNLVDWFRSLDVLVLHHNMWLQWLPKDWKGLQDKDKRPPQLKILIGNTAALGMDNLFLRTDVTLELLKCCPQLYEVKTAMNGVLDPICASTTSLLAPDLPLLTSSSLILGCNMEALSGRMTTIREYQAMPDLMTRARKLFPRIQRLEVTTSSLESVTQINSFTDVTDLSLCYLNSVAVPFQELPEDVLTKLRLKHLSLKFALGVSLSTIARNWPHLQSLSVLSCCVKEEPEISPGSLQSLVTLGLRLCKNDTKLQRHALYTLLAAAANLQTLRLEGGVLTSFFLLRCCEKSFPNIQRLTLGTDKPLSELKLCVKDLMCLVKALPSLRYVAADSYDLRLFFLHYMPAVTLNWCHCTTCAAEFPRLSDEHERLWSRVNGRRSSGLRACQEMKSAAWDMHVTAHRSKSVS